ncbi:MAG: MFS transporter [Acidobacteriia bacterium]|nr:MFS transporter [Terriglobia bacterium]
MLRRVFKAFQYRDFRLMWMGACASSIGTWMQMVAQGWLIYRLSNSPFLLALDPVLQTVPIFLLSLIGGVVADRVERRYLLMVSQYIQMSCAVLLTVLVGFHVVKVWHLLTCSFIAGFGQAFGGPAYSALIPTLVKKEDVPNAIALNSIQFNAAVMVGPALSALVLAKFGETWCFALNGASFLAPIIALSLLSVRFRPVKTDESILTSLKAGIRFIRRQGSMALLILLAFAMTFLAVPMRTFLPVFAKTIFHRGAETYALFLSISGMGSIVGALAVAGLGNISAKGRVALTMLIGLGGSISVFAVSRSIPVSAVALFVSGAATMAVFAAVNSLVQLIVTNEMRGRVMSVYNFAFRGGMTAGNLITGWLVPIFTAPAVLAVNGLVLVALAVYFLLAQRQVAEL